MTHEVFLNFRGVEMRKTFVSHLLSAFKTKYITSFIASEPFEVLDHEAMENSLVVIPVISKSYMISDWWLEDLSRIIECEKIGNLTTVIPIFFQVNPLDILTHAGKHANVQNETLEMVRKWVYAQMSRKSSFHSNDWEDDSELVDKITRSVFDILISSESNYYSTGLSPVRSLTLKSESSLTSEFTCDTGTRQWGSFPGFRFTDFSSSKRLCMKLRLKELRALLQRTESHVIGICGREGVGKTTLGRAIYEEISPQFQHHYSMNNFSGKAFQCFISLKQILPNADFRESSFHERSYDAIKEMIGHRKVLLVADGVDDIKQLRAIIEDASWFGPGSRVIVITQSRSLLTECGVKHIYEVECPRYDEALAFFSEFAFKQSTPLPDFEGLSFRAVQVANRLPLALKVLGSFLHDREKDEWVSTLRRLEASRDNYTSEVNRYLGADDYAPRRPIKVDRHIGVDEANSFPLYCLALE